MDKTRPSIAVHEISTIEEEGKSISKQSRKPDFDTQSRRSDAFSMKSFKSSKLGARTLQKLEKQLDDRLQFFTDQIDQLWTQVYEWREKHETSWKVCSEHSLQLKEALELAKLEKGLVGKKSYEQNPLGTAAPIFNEMQEVLED